MLELRVFMGTDTGALIKGVLIIDAATEISVGSITSPPMDVLSDAAPADERLSASNEVFFLSVSL